MKAKLGYLVCLALAGSPGCSKDKSEAETFVDSYCAEIARCCSQAGLSADDQSCRGEWALYALAGPFDRQAGNACLAEIRSQVSAGRFCQSLSQSFPAACASVHGGAGGSRQPGETCRFDGDCAATGDGQVKCVSANIGGDFVSKCQVLSLGKAGDTPCTGTQDGGDFVSYDDPNATEVPARAYVCSMDDGLQCRLGTCSALFAIGVDCTVSSDCVRNAFCAAKKCVARVAAGGTCAGGDTRECPDGSYCDLAAKQCTTKVASGGKCSTSGNCQSGYCLNNTCAEDLTGLASYCGD